MAMKSFSQTIIPVVIFKFIYILLNYSDKLSENFDKLYPQELVRIFFLLLPSARSNTHRKNIFDRVVGPAKERGIRVGTLRGLIGVGRGTSLKVAGTPPHEPGAGQSFRSPSPDYAAG
jgi:hypothetical protein